MKIIKKIMIVLLVLVVVSIGGIWIWSTTSYEALDEMYDAIESMDSSVEVYEDFDEISFTVENPKKNIVFLPGGLVEPESYSYMAINLAEAGYNVTISKALFNLAIFSYWNVDQFLDEELDNVIMGHSLGGVTSSLVASDNDLVDEIIFMASYPIADVNDKDVFFILAELDFDETDERLVANLGYSNDETFFVIEGGNHAQFGWYGKQKGDLDAEIDTITQQDIIVSKVLEFIG